MEVTFTVHGKPVAKQAPRRSPRGFYLPGETRDYQGAVSAAFLAACEASFRPQAKEWERPVAAVIRYTRPQPNHWPAWRRHATRHNTMKPDLDNLCKAVLDGLKGVAFADDCQVCSLRLDKEWGGDYEVSVTLTYLA